MAERWCGQLHPGMSDAIRHAEQHLGTFRRTTAVYKGTTIHNEGLIVGFALSPRKRWRLDYGPVKLSLLHEAGLRRPEHLSHPDPDKAGMSRLSFVHVNEEDFDAPLCDQKIVHMVDSTCDIQVALQYQKWNKNPRYTGS